MEKTDIFDKHPPKMMHVLDILHEFQKASRWNYVSEQDMRRAAGYLNTSLSSIYGIASYYSMFSLTPRGAHIIRICRSPVCHLGGVIDLLAELSTMLDIDIGDTTADRLFTLETSECLGHCESAPAMMIDAVVYGNLTLDTIKTIIARYRNDHSPGGSDRI